MTSRQCLSILATFLATAALVPPSLAQSLGDGSGYDNDRLQPGLYPAAPVPKAFAVPQEPGHSPLEIDWSLGLRGSFTRSDDGESFVTTLNPEASGTYAGSRNTLTFRTGAEIAKVGGSDELTVTAIDAGVSGSYALDSVTTISGDVNLDYSRELADTPGLDPLIIRPAEEISGTVGLGIDRRFGLFSVGLRGTGERTAYGDTLRTDTGETSNADENFWSAGTTLRFGYQATPIFEVFGEGGISRDLFDEPSTSLGERLDATEQTLRGGITGRWNSVLSATASVGVGNRDFDTQGFDDVTTQLYDASVTFSPDPTLNLRAGLSTAIAPPGADSSGTAKVERTATADIDYTVNAWLRLRASADWVEARQVDGDETETRYGLGAGADYSVSQHTSLSADYAYGHRDNSNDGTLDSHKVSLGIVLKR